MPDEQRGAERAAGVARRRLDPDVLERPFAQQPAVGDAVERDAAGQHQVLHAGLAGAASRPMRSTTSSVTRLDAGRQIHVPLLERRLRLARRPAEQLVEPLVRHRQALAVVEVLHVQPEAAVGLEIDQVLVGSASR